LRKTTWIRTWVSATRAKKKKIAAEVAWRERLVKEAEADGIFLDSTTGDENFCARYESHERAHSGYEGSYVRFFESFAEDDPEAFGNDADRASYFHEEDRAYRLYAAEEFGRGKARADRASAQQRATRKRDEDAQRILDAARRQDAEWRARVAGAGRAGEGGDARLRTDGKTEKMSSGAYRRAWGRVAAMADRGAPIAHDDVPWPTGEGALASSDEVREVLLGNRANGDAPVSPRFLFRQEMLRWHPDKFETRLGRSIVERDRNRVRARVNVVARLVAELFQGSKRTGHA
jgi:hypothetical protein